MMTLRTTVFKEVPDIIDDDIKDHLIQRGSGYN